jgi:RNA polymerase sigma-70 factor (ECF subfamily)
MQDKQIIELYFNRDETAIAITTEKYGNYMFKIAFNILGDEEDVNEVLNDTYLSVWNSIPPNNPEIFSSYLVKLVRRKAIDRFRANTRQKRIPTEYTVSTDELDDILKGGESPESVYEAKQLSGGAYAINLGEHGEKLVSVIRK